MPQSRYAETFHQGCAELEQEADVFVLTPDRDVA
jgi:hypothetical protein